MILGLQGRAFRRRTAAATSSQWGRDSANPAYAPIEADTRDQLGNLVHIIGRAVRVGRELE